MREPMLAFLRRVMLLLLLGAVSTIVWAQEGDLDPVTGTYVIKNVNIIQGPGRKIDMGAILIKNGIIMSVGKTVAIPPDARIIEADSMYVYSGFIDGLSHTGVPKPKDEDKAPKVKDPGNPPNDVAGIEPQVDVRNLLKPDDKSIDEWRRLGFTTAQVVPYGKMLPGKSAIILLAGKNADELVYHEEKALFSQLEGAPRVYPNTVIGVMAKYRELYRQAQQAEAYQARYSQDASGMERPKSDRVLEAFYPVVDKQMPVVFKAEKVLDIQRVLVLQKDLGFNLILAEIKEGWDITDKLKASGAKLFLSMDLPAMEEKKEADSTKTDEPAKKSELDIEREHLQARKDEMIKKFYTQPALFKSKGIDFGFSTMEAKSKDFKANLQKLIENGLTEDAALASLTTIPAQQLGLSAAMGSIDNGKMANLVVSDKPYFSKESKVKYVFVDGRMFEYKDQPAKKGEKGSAKAEGTWSYSVETPDGEDTGELTINGESGNYTGTITRSSTGESYELYHVVLDGNNLSFSFDALINGDTVTIGVNVVIEGDSFEGTVDAGEHGSFQIKGERTPEK